MKAKRRRPREKDWLEELQTFFDDHPEWMPAIVFFVVPLIFNAFMMLLMIAEANASWEVFAVSMIAAWGVGVVAGGFEFSLPAACAAAAWFPALLSWKRVYWSLNMPSPAGTAQSLIRGATGAELPGWIAVSLLMALVGLCGWGPARFSSRR